MEIHSFTVTPFASNCYVIQENDEAFVIDPGEATAPLLHHIKNLKIHAIINTHGHCDHCGGNAVLINATNAPLYIHEQDLPLLQNLQLQGKMFGVSFPASPDPTGVLHAGDTFQLGNTTLTVLHTPGHSPGHIALATDGIVFTGDTLFAGSIGRTDLFDGNYEDIMRSIREVLLPLPDNTRVYPGHGPETTIEIERHTNPFLGEL